MLLRVFIYGMAIFLSHDVLAQSSFSRPADAIKYRQSAFQVMSFHSQRIGAMSKGDRPFDKQIAIQDAAVIELLATQMESAFPPGTESAPSRAKPEVWQDAGQFKQKMDEFKSTARKLSEASKTGDLNNIKAAFGQTAQSCKSCHEGFRNR